MKRFLFLVLLAVCCFGAQAQLNGATLQATGLTCAMCSNAVNKALQKVPFVQSVKSDIKNSAFEIMFKKEMEVSIDEIRKAVEDAGFSIGSLKVAGVFNNLRITKHEHVTIGSANFHFLNGDGKVIDGEQVFTVVDKHFVTEKQFKKISAGSSMECVRTGKTAKCCKMDGIAEGARVYHITI